jgi:ketosteroid isomerase-like protein
MNGLIEAALRRTDLDFFAALVDRDGDALERLLAADFLIVDLASGTVHRRDSFIEVVTGGVVTFQKIETFPGQTNVRFSGAGAGIVVGRILMSLVGPDGGSSDIASRFTHVFFRANGAGWQLVSAQGTPIRPTSSS